MGTDDTFTASRRALSSLREVAERTRRLIGADGVGATVLLAPETSFFAGSNLFTENIDAVQYEISEGPCLLSVTTRAVVRSATIGAGERRWSSFSPRAAALDLRSVVSVPIVSGGDVIGSLNLYGRRTDSFATVESAEVERLGAEAGPMLSAVRLLALTEMGAVSLADAVHDHAVIERAVGLLMDRYAMSASQARLLIQQIARRDAVAEPFAARSLTSDQASA